MADIVGSTALYETLGNAAAKQRVVACLDMLARTARTFSGTVNKSLGDGILCCFEQAQEALAAALTMCSGSGELGLELRVGVDLGEVLEEHGDVFGDAVNTAARIVDLAKPREILVTRAAVETLPRFMRVMTRQVPPVSVKGKRNPVELFTLLQRTLEKDDADCTVVGSSIGVGAEPPELRCRLHVSYEDRAFALGQEDELVIGRDAESGLRITSVNVSRRHARIFCLRGKHVLVDQSANGTVLVPEGGQELHVVREQVTLLGSGEIYLGVDPDVRLPEPIRYHTA